MTALLSGSPNLSVSTKLYRHSRRLHFWALVMAHADDLMLLLLWARCERDALTDLLLMPLRMLHLRPFRFVGLRIGGAAASSVASRTFRAISWAGSSSEKRAAAASVLASVALAPAPRRAYGPTSAAA